MLSEHREGRVAGLEPRVPAEAHDGLGATLRGHLVVEERAEPLEDRERDVEVVHLVAMS